MVYSDLPIYFFLFSALYFQIFILVTFLEKKEENYFPLAHDAEYPTVAITVPCFNESKTLTKTVLSLLALDYPKKKLEILVVDDGSTDDTYRVARSLVKQYPQVKLIHQKNGGKHTAINLGIKNTKAEFISCLDADSEVASDALRIMIPLFAKSPDVAAVTPAIRVHKPTSIWQFMQCGEYNLGIFAKRILGRLDAIHVTPGPFSIFRREVFAEIGPFRNAHNTEDMEIAFRIQKHGLRIENCHKAYVYTITPPTLKRLYKQRVRWVAGFMKNSIDYRDLFFKKSAGNMAYLTLPFAAISIIGTFYAIFTLVYHFSVSISNLITRISTVGFDMSLPKHLMNWFFVSTQTTSFVALILLCLTLSFILLGRKFAEGTMKPSRDMLYFLVLYGFIAPLWLSKALYDTVLWKKTPWR